MNPVGVCCKRVSKSNINRVKEAMGKWLIPITCRVRHTEGVYYDIYFDTSFFVPAVQPRDAITSDVGEVCDLATVVETLRKRETFGKEVIPKLQLKYANGKTFYVMIVPALTQSECQARYLSQTLKDESGSEDGCDLCY